MPPGLAAAAQPAAGGVRVCVRITPKARRDGVEGLAETAAGGAEVRVSVTAAPEDGKANRALIKLLAKLWGVPKSAVAIVSGETDRHKILSISGDPERILRRIAETLPDKGPPS
ncbi:DUF167 family protein [Oleispirillum naphthae]|uniref:DUF167 domain-containing protein n=1 Tax=Oleispirillum naphthae TaxID=2838853 RepID=UPI0030823474